MDFCKRRTEVVRDLWFTQKDDDRKKKIAKKIWYRLPSKSELSYAKASNKEIN